MRKLALVVGLISPVLVTSAASAQTFGVYVGPSYGPYTSMYYDDIPRPSYRPDSGVRVYGYTRYADEYDGRTERQRRSGGCGTYYYWDGDACVDARDRR